VELRQHHHRHYDPSEIGSGRLAFRLYQFGGDKRHHPDLRQHYRVGQQDWFDYHGGLEDRLHDLRCGVLDWTDDCYSRDDS
jgi:hypothetical protein